MNWDAIGAVGDFVGGAAVIVTLAYLALQVRASTKESEASAFTVTGAQMNLIRSQLMEHVEVWVKGNSGSELSAPERIVFDQLVESRADHHFIGFSRSVIRGSGRQGIHVSALALFLHQYPAAYASWRTYNQSLMLSRQRLSVPGTFSNEWIRSVTEAVAALEGMEEPAEA